MNDARPTPEPTGIFAPMTLEKQSNRMANTGLVLAILVWPVGLVLSAIALVRSRSRGGTGQTSSILGLVFGVIVAVTTFAVVSTLENSPAPGDPGCAAAKSAALALQDPGTETTQVAAEAAALQTAEGKASSQKAKAAINAAYNSAHLYAQELQTGVGDQLTLAVQLQESLETLDRICQYPN